MWMPSRTLSVTMMATLSIASRHDVLDRAGLADAAPADAALAAAQPPPRRGFAMRPKAKGEEEAAFASKEAVRISQNRT